MYLYSAYAPQLAAQLQFSVTQTSMMGLIGSLGSALTGPISGAIVDARGPSISIVIGAFLIAFGYSVVTNAYVNTISSFPLVSSALLCVGGGSTFVLSAVMKCAAVNFPHVRGFATSIPMAAFGLSAFVLAQISGYMYPGNTYGLLLLLSYLPLAIFLFSFFFVKFMPQPYTFLQNDGTRAVRSSIELVGHARQPSFEVVLHNTKSDVNIHGNELFKSSLFWSHFVIMALLAGVGQMYIYSCGYIVKALLLSDHTHIATSVAADIAVEDTKEFRALVQSMQSFHVGILSLSSFMGRLCSGSLSDYLVSRLSRQRDWLLVGAGLFCFIAQAGGLNVTSIEHLWIVSSCTGLMYGMCFGSYPTIIGDAFGMKNFSQNWGILALSPIPTAYTFNWLFGKVYDGNSVIDEFGIRECTLGIKCYSQAFKTSLFASVVIILLASHVLVRQRNHGGGN